MERLFFHNPYDVESINLLATLDGTYKIYKVFGDDKDELPLDINIPHLPYIIDKQLSLSTQPPYTTGMLNLQFICLDHEGAPIPTETKDFDVFIDGYRDTVTAIDGKIHLQLDILKPSTVSIKIIGNEYMPFEIIVEVELSLNDAKLQKIKELSKLCSQTILGRFSSAVDDNIYSFSNDEEAQLNFSKVKDAFKEGYIDNINWTAYDNNGEVVRLNLDWERFEPIFIDHLDHIQSNISKFRDILHPMVENAKTVEEIDMIMWDSV